MAEGIVHSMRRVIINAFREGIDKHAVKQSGEGDGYVFSYSTKFNLLDTAFQFGNYLKSIGINRDYKVTKTNVRDFLDAKAEDCTQSTLDRYRSEIKKIGELLDHDWDCGKVLSSCVGGSASRGVLSVISAGDLSKIIEYGDVHKPCASAVCIKLEREIGVRIGDMCFGIVVKPDVLEIKCKGGKVLYREITPQIREIIDSEAFKKYLEGEKWKPVSDDAVNRYLNRVQDKLGLKRHSFHDIRRRIAQDKYDSFREAGISRSKAIDMTAVWLNHNGGREDMLRKSYIKAW